MTMILLIIFLINSCEWYPIYFIYFSNPKYLYLLYSDYAFYCINSWVNRKRIGEHKHRTKQ